MVNPFHDLHERLTLTHSTEEDVEFITLEFSLMAILTLTALEEHLKTLSGTGINGVAIPTMLLEECGCARYIDLNPHPLQFSNPPLRVGFLIEVLIPDGEVDTIEMDLLETLQGG